RARPGNHSLCAAAWPREPARTGAADSEPPAAARPWHTGKRRECLRSGPTRPARAAYLAGQSAASPKENAPDSEHGNEHAATASRAALPVISVATLLHHRTNTANFV